MIEVAISPDGLRVALDTDERFSGPPGRALVFTQAPPGYHRSDEEIGESMRAELTQVQDKMASVQQNALDVQLAALDRARAAGLDEATYQASKERLLARNAPDAADAASTPGGALGEDDPLAALEQAHRAGQIGAVQYRIMKAALERVQRR